MDEEDRHPRPGGRSAREPGHGPPRAGGGHEPGRARRRRDPAGVRGGVPDDHLPDRSPSASGRRRRRCWQQLEDGADFGAIAREQLGGPVRPEGRAGREPRRGSTCRTSWPPPRSPSSPATSRDPSSPASAGRVVRVESFGPADPARLDELRPSLRTLVRFRKAEVLRAELGARLRARTPGRDRRGRGGGDRPRAAPRRTADAEGRGPRTRWSRASATARSPPSSLGQALGLRWKGVRERGGGPRGQAHRPRPAGPGGADGGRGPGPRLRGHAARRSARSTPTRPSSSSRAT